MKVGDLRTQIVRTWSIWGESAVNAEYGILGPVKGKSEDPPVPTEGKEAWLTTDEEPMCCICFG